MIDQALEALGLGFLVHEWLADRSIVMFTLFVVISWKYFGFHMIIMLAGLQGIPRELEEAAAIDGASRRQTIRGSSPCRCWDPPSGCRCSCPSSAPSSCSTWCGRPREAARSMPRTRWRPITSTWGIERTQMGYGSAVAVILFAVALVVALAYLRS